jgi:alpha-glucosidase (family GH31 glycosyl hydrolase)
LLQSSISGISFIGSDVPGFFHDPPEDEFVVRTYQSGAFLPFFRAHAHHDCKRREPWTFGPEICQKISDLIHMRYKYLPYMYSAFYQSHLRGEPILRPLWYAYPELPEVNTVETEYMLGDCLLVCPVLEPGLKK